LGTSGLCSSANADDGGGNAPAIPLLLPLGVDEAIVDEETAGDDVSLIVFSLFI
jgi:hypothetical protein